MVARVVPKQAEPFFFRDLLILSSEILRRMNTHLRSPSQLYVLARDQAFFKIQFFGGDRAGDLGRVRTQEMLSPRGFPLLRVISLRDLNLS